MDDRETPDALAVARAWQDAANRADVERLLALSHEDVEIAGPRGSVRGREVLRVWLARAGLTLDTRRVFARGGEVVMAQQGVWRSSDTGGVVGEAGVATRFRVEGGRVAYLARFDALEDALAAAGLGEADEAAAG